jgi:hypothetical protein
MEWPPLEGWGADTGVAWVSFFHAFDETSDGSACVGLWRAAGMRGLWGPCCVGGGACRPPWAGRYGRWGLACRGRWGALVDWSAGTFGGEAGARCWLLACAWAGLCCGARGGRVEGLAQGLCGGCAVPRRGPHGHLVRGHATALQKDVIAPRFSVAFVHTLSILPLRLPFGHW